MASKRTNTTIDIPPTGIDRNYWGGKESDNNANKVRIARFAITLVILVEIMTFAGLISAYIILSNNNQFNWPPKGQPIYPKEATLLNTLILLASGVTMFLFRKKWLSKTENTRLLKTLLYSTCAGGILFLLLQGSEWVKLINFGLTMKSSIYGSIFYTIIGFHAIHVLCAVIWLVISSISAVRFDFKKTVISLDTCGLFWYFVVLLWPLLYGIIYF